LTAGLQSLPALRDQDDCISIKNRRADAKNYGGSTSTARVKARIYHMFQSFDPPHFPLERRPAHPLWFEENIINAPILVLQGRPQSLKLIHGPMERRAALRTVCEPVSLPRCEDGSARRQVELQGSALRQRTDKPPSSTPEGLWGSG